MTGEEKAYYGDLYAGYIITDIDEYYYQNPEKATDIEERTWFYRFYVTTLSIMELFETGTVTWTCRKNL